MVAPPHPASHATWTAAAVLICGGQPTAWSSSRCAWRAAAQSRANVSVPLISPKCMDLSVRKDLQALDMDGQHTRASTRVATQQ